MARVDCILKELSHIFFHCSNSHIVGPISGLQKEYWKWPLQGQLSYNI